MTPERGIGLWRAGFDDGGGAGRRADAQARTPRRSLYGEALAYPELHPVAEALPVLERRLPKAETLGERRAILDDLSAQDSEAATRVLLDWLKDAPSGRNPIVGDRHDPLYRQVWRTGRTAATNLCVGGTRPVPELAAPAQDGSIGTATAALPDRRPGRELGRHLPGAAGHQPRRHDLGRVRPPR